MPRCASNNPHPFTFTPLNQTMLILTTFLLIVYYNRKTLAEK